MATGTSVGAIYAWRLYVVSRQQQRLLADQDERSRPKLAIGTINPPSWEADRTLRIAFECANVGGGTVALYQVILTFERDGKTNAFIGRVTERRSHGVGLSLGPSEYGTFVAYIPLHDYKPTLDEPVTLQVLSFGGPRSEMSIAPRISG